MTNLEDIIRYENESTYLDFKSIQYKRHTHESFLKDILSMANADYFGSKYIVTGVKPNGDGTRDILGIVETIIDEATYQQLIEENIEPSLSITYTPFMLDSHLLYVFTISNTIDQPYMLKKDFGNLKKGQMFIRKGSTQLPVLRADINRMLSQKNENLVTNDSISVKFEDGSDQKTLTPITGIDLPSNYQLNDVQREIKKRKAPPDLSRAITGIIHHFPLPGRYDRLTDEQLQERLKKIPEIYWEDDLHYLFEKKGSLLNFEIRNNGAGYVEDASIKVVIPKSQGLIVAERIYKQQRRDHLGYINSSMFGEIDTQNMDYPTVEITETAYVITQAIGNLKHHIPEIVFRQPVRMHFSDVLYDSTIILQITIFGKNLKAPIHKELAFVIKATEK
jgi:hypothetical protein